MADHSMTPNGGENCDVRLDRVAELAQAFYPGDPDPMNRLDQLAERFKVRPALPAPVARGVAPRVDGDAPDAETALTRPLDALIAHCDLVRRRSYRGSAQPF